MHLEMLDGAGFKVLVLDAWLWESVFSVSTLAPIFNPYIEFAIGSKFGAIQGLP